MTAAERATPTATDGGKPIRALRGRLVTLQPFADRFVSDEYLGWLRDDAVTRYIVKAGADTTLDDVRAFCTAMIRSERDFFFAIVRNDTGRHIGNVRLGPVEFDASEAHFGILIGDAASHGMGIGAEVVDLITGFCFDDLKIDRLSFPVVAENAPAMRLYDKCGFTNEGASDEVLVKDGHTYDMIVWSKTKRAERRG